MTVSPILFDYIGTGLDADKPADPNTAARSGLGSANLSGLVLWYSTDTDELSVWNNITASWALFSGTGFSDLSSFTTDDLAEGSNLYYTDGAVDARISTVIDTDTTLAANSDAKVASQKAVKAYIDAAVIGAGSYTDEAARDALGTALTAGTGIAVTPNDGADTITIATTITQYTDEMARDALGSAITAGTGISVTPNDGADTITIASTITQYTDEAAQDAVGAMVVSGDIVYDDATPKLSVRRYVQIAVTDPAGSAIATGDSQGVPFVVPAFMNGWKLKSVQGHVTTVSSSGLPTVQVRNATGPVDMLSTKLSIDATEKDSATAATAAVIDTASSHDVLATGDEIWIDVDVAGTGAKGLSVTLGIGAP